MTDPVEVMPMRLPCMCVCVRVCATMPITGTPGWLAESGAQGEKLSSLFPLPQKFRGADLPFTPSYIVSPTSGRVLRSLEPYKAQGESLRSRRIIVMFADSFSPSPYLLRSSNKDIVHTRTVIVSRPRFSGSPRGDLGCPFQR